MNQSPDFVRTFFILFYILMKKVIVIGGGLGGLISSILLVRGGYHVTLIEEKKYPFHRVCGEYISNEVIPFLKRNGLYPGELSPCSISKFHLTSPSGVSLKMSLDLGGFGISRFEFDQWLYKKAIAEGVTFHFDRAKYCQFEEDSFRVETKNEQVFTGDLAIGAFGKRSMLDKSLKRDFFNKKYPYVGVKYHIATDVAASNEIALHNFRNGYCGISRVENDKFNLCYLTHRSNLKQFGSIPIMEENVLFKNPFLKKIYANSDFLFEKPEVINEVSFYPKEPVHNHMLMIGDAAGMIAPLCGNGMAMAIHSAKILCDIITKTAKEPFDREKLEAEYMAAWRTQFQKRLWVGRKIQYLFGAEFLTEFAVRVNKSFPVVARLLMKKTHGKVF